MDGGGWKATVHRGPWGCWGLDTTEWLHFHFYALEKERATHSSVLALRIPGMGEPGGLLSMGLHRVGHDWSDLVVVVKNLFKLLYTFFFFSTVVVYWQFTWCQGKDQKKVLVNFHPLPDFAQAFVFYKWSPLNLWPFPMPCLFKVSMSQWHRLGNLELERTTERAGPEFLQSGLWIFSPERDSMGKKDIWHNIFARSSLLSPL